MMHCEVSCVASQIGSYFLVPGGAIGRHVSDLHNRYH